MSLYLATKKRFKIYLLKKKLKGLESQLSKVELNLYFERWSGADCIEESNYLILEINAIKKLLSLATI